MLMEIGNEEAPYFEYIFLEGGNPSSFRVLSFGVSLLSNVSSVIVMYILESGGPPNGFGEAWVKRSQTYK